MKGCDCGLIRTPVHNKADLRGFFEGVIQHMRLPNPRGDRFHVAGQDTPEALVKRRVCTLLLRLPMPGCADSAHRRMSIDDAEPIFVTIHHNHSPYPMPYCTT
eukprot:1188897-Prorocentrum_minimum.AAC.1